MLPAPDSVREDVLSALGNLGYQRATARRPRTVYSVAGNPSRFESVLRDVLKNWRDDRGRMKDESLVNACRR